MDILFAFRSIVCKKRKECSIKCAINACTQNIRDCPPFANDDRDPKANSFRWAGVSRVNNVVLVVGGKGTAGDSTFYSPATNWFRTRCYIGYDWLSCATMGMLSTPSSNLCKDCTIPTAVLWSGCVGSLYLHLRRSILHGCSDIIVHTHEAISKLFGRHHSIPLRCVFSDITPLHTVALDMSRGYAFTP